MVCVVVSRSMGHIHRKEKYCGNGRQNRIGPLRVSTIF